MAEYSVSGAYDFLTRPIVDVWEGLLRRGREAKKIFKERCDQVESFYSGGAGAMWDPAYMSRFMGGPNAIQAPKFKITLNVAFEQIAILGPLLFWEMADRKVRPHRALQLDPSVLAAGNPELEQYFSQLADQQASEDARNEMRARVLEHVLNYFQREQPGGGLSKHSELAVFEALLKGCGFLRTDDYKFPFSDRKLVGSFFVPSDDVLVDPDCRDPLWTSARWVAIRHVSKYFEVEEHFNLPPGSLRCYSQLSSSNSAYIMDSTNVPPRKQQVSKDCVEWYEIFSKAGIGNKLAGTKETIDPMFESARGDDYAYLCICPGCPYPLNVTSRDLVQPWATDEWFKEQTDWPTEYWRDNKWPVTMLSFYPHNGVSPWPEPPLAPALGELTILNILISAYVQQAYENRQQIIATMKGAIENLPQLLQSSVSPLAIELQPELNRTVNEVVQFLKRPEINNDIPKTIEFVMMLLEKRTGLREEMYGGTSGANPRSATEYQGRLDTANIRPEHMQKKVAAWQSAVADSEVFCSYIHVSSRDIAEQLGPLGVATWDELVTNEAPEAILRGSKAFVEASAIRRPNKAKDSADLQAMQQYLIPVLQGYMAQTGNQLPMNGFIKAMGEAMEMDVSEFLFPEQQPDENAQQMQQLEMERAQAEVEKLSADAEKSRATAMATANQAQSSEHDAMLKQQTAEHAMSLKERDAELKQMTQAQSMEQRRREAQQKLALQLAQGVQKLKSSEHDAMLKQQTAEHAMSLKERDAELKQMTQAQSMEQRRREAQQKLALQLAQGVQKLNMNEQSHAHGLQLANEQASEEARRGNMITAQKMLMSNAMHQQRLAQTNQQGGNA